LLFYLIINKKNSRQIDVVVIRDVVVIVILCSALR